MRDFGAALDDLDAASLLRTRRVVDGEQGPILEVDGRRLVAFASNDYLGLAAHPRLAEAVIDAVRRFGIGAGASHLISGHHAEHERLETELARFVGLPKALTFSTGYMANTGVVPALVGRGDAVFSDALNHACLIDAARLSRADIHVYPHADFAALDAALARSTAPNKLVLSDAVFSMDGDIAPVREIIAACERHDAWLLLDDAHGFGVLGEDGAGTLSHLGARSPRVLCMGTLGKGAGVAGAFVAGESDVIEWLVQRARTYVFTTATPPMLAAAVRASLVLIRTEPWRRERLRAHAALLRQRLQGLPWPLLDSRTAIQPLIVGDNALVMRLMDRLWALGFWVPGIRPPTVPEGSARLRISLSAAHTTEQVAGLADALELVATEATAVT
ncbi:MAG: 8-amino-7-oxononanoate synthase [Betaproteobacteria bacterium]